MTRDCHRLHFTGKPAVKTATLLHGSRKETAENNKTKRMTKLEIKGDWNIIKGNLKQKWAKLTDDDLQYAEGKQEELIGRIQKRTGETREAVEKAVKDSCSTGNCCN